MKRSNVKLCATRKLKRILYGPIDPRNVVFKSVPKWAYGYLEKRDNDIFAALARADSESD